MGVCKAAALQWTTAPGPNGEALEEWRLAPDQTEGAKDRRGYANSGLRITIDLLQRMGSQQNPPRR